MYIGRNKDGSIYGLWTVRQWDGQEELPDDAPDVAAFNEAQAAKMTAAKEQSRTLEARIAALEQKGA